jgi:DNA-binding NarL/FixJ family response regulator
MRAALRGLLEDADLPVIGEASDGLQAISLVAQLEPDVVVMDLRMPGVDGLQATKHITSAHPYVRVVVYSAFNSHGTQQAARQAGATAFVVKGGPPNQVHAAVLAAWQAEHNPPSFDPDVE